MHPAGESAFWRSPARGLAVAARRPAPGGPGRADGRGARRSGRCRRRAEVTVTELAHAQAVTVTTGPEGIFNVPYLRPGSYRIAAEAPGFRAVGARRRALATGERVRVDLTLADRRLRGSDRRSPPTRRCCRPSRAASARSSRTAASCSFR